MCGWLDGIIFSKLALSVSRVAANQASTTVAIAQATITIVRWLKTSRSSRLPVAGSKSARSRTTGMWSRSSVTAAMSVLQEFLSTRRQCAHRDAARAHQGQAAVAGLGDAGQRHRLLQCHGLEVLAAGGAHREPPA